MSKNIVTPQKVKEISNQDLGWSSEKEKKLLESVGFPFLESPCFLVWALNGIYNSKREFNAMLQALSWRI